MSTLLKLTAATAACIFSTGILSAQSNDAATPETDQMPDQIKCHELVTMDTAMVSDALYYIAGYRHGSESAAATDGTADAANTDSQNGDDGSDPAGSDTNTASPQIEAEQTDNAADMPAEDTDDATSESDTTASPDPESQAHNVDAGELPAARISGFYEIPVEDVLIACADTPDSNVADVVDDMRDRPASDTQ